jgi:HEPN domain-containing protein
MSFMAPPELDRYDIPTRYPNGLPDGRPFEAFDARDSADAVALAAETIAAVRSRIPA